MDTLDRAQVVDLNFIEALHTTSFPVSDCLTSPEAVGLERADYLDLLHSQLVSRHLDLFARVLKEKQQGFYTIGSSGHEGNAAIAKVFRPTDMAFLHYRSGAFFIQRAKQKQQDYIRDQVLSLVASANDPISGGRHKVFGSVSLMIPPQTSTIASHLPKAVGMALAITRTKAMKQTGVSPADSVVLCSFGDASFNHSTAQGALNAAQWIVRHHFPLPIVFICEDNQIGISVQTPRDWIEEQVSSRPYLQYVVCDGRSLADVTRAAKQAEYIARTQKKAVFLHMKTVRLLGHAGSDIESQYLSLDTILANEKDDPLLHSAKTVITRGWITPEALLDWYREISDSVARQAEWAVQQPRLKTLAEIQAPLVPPVLEKPVPALPTQAMRQAAFGKQFLQLEQPRNLCQLINFALTDLMIQYPQMVLFGEDVGKKGGVYRVTADLQVRFGVARVFDTLLDEQTILGTAIGFSHQGLLPVPEIQFLAYLHNAIDQIRGEAATLSFFSNGQFANPMVLRLPSFAYQRGFGGHFHNDNAFAAIREIPGVVIACPSDGASAVRLLRTCMQLAYREQRVVIFMEPIARYMTKDLYTPGDNLFLKKYPPLAENIPFKTVSCLRQGKDLVIITYGNGCYLSLQAAKQLEEGHHISACVIDLQWLAPLPTDSLQAAIAGYKNILLVDECRKTGSISEQLITWLAETQSSSPRILRCTAADCFIPLGNAWEAVVPSVEQIVETALNLLIKENA